ncbi:MAG: hypothetical protein E7A34_15565, partial [Leclercia adecarboxylata]|nr:hypothetical protein [Leclercia adecarboxylata]
DGQSQAPTATLPNPHKKTLSSSHFYESARKLFHFHNPALPAQERDIHHVRPAKNHHSAQLCGTDHWRRSPFHFEVENNSLQTHNSGR